MASDSIFKMEIKKESEPAPGPLGLGSLYTQGLGCVLGVGLLSMLPIAISSMGLRAGLFFPLCVLCGFIYSIPNILSTMAFRQGGGNVSVVSALSSNPLVVGFFVCSNILTSVSAATTCLALGNYVNAAFPSLPASVVSVVAYTLFYVLSLMGSKAVAKVQNNMLPILGVGLALFVIFAFANRTMPIVNTASPEWSYGGVSGFFTGWYMMTMCSVAYSSIAFSGRDCKNARRDIPRATMLVVATILVLYTLFGIAATTIIPASEVGTTLINIAKVIFPSWLYPIWFAVVPFLLVATTTNAQMSQYARMLQQTAYDGWLPKAMARENKHGVPWIMLTIIWILGLLPIFFHISLSEFISNTALLTFFSGLLFRILMFKLPTKYKNVYEHSSLKRIPIPVYHLLNVLSTLVLILTLVNTFLNVRLPLVLFTLGLIAVCLIWTIFRLKKGGARIVISAWAPEEDM